MLAMICNLGRPFYLSPRVDSVAWKYQTRHTSVGFHRILPTNDSVFLEKELMEILRSLFSYESCCNPLNGVALPRKVTPEQGHQPVLISTQTFCEEGLDQPAGAFQWFIRFPQENGQIFEFKYNLAQTQANNHRIYNWTLDFRVAHSSCKTLKYSPYLNWLLILTQKVHQFCYSS